MLNSHLICLYCICKVVHQPHQAKAKPLFLLLLLLCTTAPEAARAQLQLRSQTPFLSSLFFSSFPFFAKASLWSFCQILKPKRQTGFQKSFYEDFTFQPSDTVHSRESRSLGRKSCSDLSQETLPLKSHHHQVLAGEVDNIGGVGVGRKGRIEETHIRGAPFLSLGSLFMGCSRPMYLSFVQNPSDISLHLHYPQNLPEKALPGRCGAA